MNRYDLMELRSKGAFGCFGKPAVKPDYCDVYCPCFYRRWATGNCVCRRLRYGKYEIVSVGILPNEEQECQKMHAWMESHEYDVEGYKKEMRRNERYEWDINTEDWGVTRRLKKLLEMEGYVKIWFE